MFAVDHAATALLVKRRYPSVSLIPLLLSVQAMELAWVALNYLGIERTTTEATVRSVADIHLAYMPYSHSVAIPVGAAVLTWLIIEKGFGKAALGRAVGLGIVSHLILDLATHAHDIVLWPGWSTPKLGLGLYAAAPLAAFIIEFVYGLFCWYMLSWRSRSLRTHQPWKSCESLVPVAGRSRPRGVPGRSPFASRDRDLRANRGEPSAGWRAGTPKSNRIDWSGGLRNSCGPRSTFMRRRA